MQGFLPMIKNIFRCLVPPVLISGFFAVLMVILICRAYLDKSLGEFCYLLSSLPAILAIIYCGVRAFQENWLEVSQYQRADKDIALASSFRAPTGYRWMVIQLTVMPIALFWTRIAGLIAALSTGKLNPAVLASPSVVFSLLLDLVITAAISAACYYLAFKKTATKVSKTSSGTYVTIGDRADAIDLKDCRKIFSLFDTTLINTANGADWFILHGRLLDKRAKAERGKVKALVFSSLEQ